MFTPAILSIQEETKLVHVSPIQWMKYPRYGSYYLPRVVLRSGVLAILRARFVYTLSELSPTYVYIYSPLYIYVKNKSTVVSTYVCYLITCVFYAAT
jgi:hypothetical protein